MPFSTTGWHNDTFVEAGYAAGAGVGVTIADLPDHSFWERWYPADWVSEMREQIRLWFYSMLFMGVVLDGRAPYRRVLTYEKVNDETGHPMHKSWGNAIWFADAIEDMGADVMRWMYAGQPPAQNLNFGYGPAGEVKRQLLKLWNTYSFFTIYANLEDFTPTYGLLADGPDPAAARPLDRWLVARTQWLVGECREALDSWDSPRLVRAFETFLDDLSNWYVRLSRAPVLALGRSAGRARRLRGAVVCARAGASLRVARDALHGRRDVAEPGPRSVSRRAFRNPPGRVPRGAPRAFGCRPPGVDAERAHRWSSSAAVAATTPTSGRASRCAR